MNDNRDLEILAAKGRIKGIKRELILFSCYFPPGMRKKESEGVMEVLNDAISEARAKAEAPWIVVGADWNRYDTSSIPKLFPDLKKGKQALRGGRLRFTIATQISKTIF